MSRIIDFAWSHLPERARCWLAVNVFDKSDRYCWADLVPAYMSGSSLTECKGGAYCAGPNGRRATVPWDGGEPRCYCGKFLTGESGDE